MSDTVHTEEITATVSVWIERALREVAFSAGINYPHDWKTDSTDTAIQDIRLALSRCATKHRLI